MTNIEIEEKIRIRNKRIGAYVSKGVNLFLLFVKKVGKISLRG